MIKEVKLPEVSDNIENGDVVKVLVSVGDKIEVDQPIIELETDKAMFEVPSSEKGIVKEINVKQGDVIDIGAVILKVETDGEESKEGDTKSSEDKSKEDSQEKDKEEAEPKKSAKKDSKEKKSEQTSEDKKSKEETEGKDTKAKETKDKPDTKEPTKKDSKDEKSEQKSEDKETEEGKPEKKDSEKEEEGSKAKEKEQTEKKKSDETDESKEGKNFAAASPSVRRLARELGVDINMIYGTGSGERITEEDVKNYVKSIINEQSKDGISITQKTLPDFERWGEIDKQPMSKVRVITGEAMTYAWTTIPAVTQFDKADITQVEEFRKKYSKKVEEKGGHLTVTSILVKVCTAALKAFPEFNSSIDFSKKEIIYKKYFNIGIAVDTDRGLLVPVIKETDKKTITDISAEVTDLAEKARNKKITLDEMDGGNFTISNLGGIGGTNFTPIIYPPQVAILGVSRAAKEGVYINDKFEPRLMLPLSLTYDHRIIDGANAARFLRWICEALENPILIQL